MDLSILEKYRQDVENDKSNEDNSFPQDKTPTLNESHRVAYEKRLKELRNSEISMENQYKKAMDKIKKYTEKELDAAELSSISKIPKIMVKRVYCPNCGKELVNNYPPMFNPFTHEKQCIHECECGTKYNLEYSYPRIVFLDENNKEIMAHCE